MKRIYRGKGSLIRRPAVPRTIRIRLRVHGTPTLTPPAATDKRTDFPIAA